MNQIDCYVTNILGEPYRKFGCWWIDIEYEAYGRISKTRLVLRTEEAARAVTVGHKFTA